MPRISVRPTPPPPPTVAEPLSRRQALRQQAETLLGEESAPSPERGEALLPEDTQRMLHELRVHQIELEMQNEELRQAQVVLDTARARYFDLYDLAPVGYCTLSEAGLILQSNLTAAALLGLPRGALEGQAISRFIHKADQDIYYLHRKQVFETGDSRVCELRMVRADGTPFWAHLASAVGQEPDGTAVLRVVLSDVSERKLAEAERARFAQLLQDKNAELDRARLLAETANRAKSEFVSRMSHELRTPLGAILGFAQLVDTGSPTPTPAQKRSIDQILKAGWYLLGLVNEILDLALIESGQLVLAMEPISLPDLLAECKDLVETQAAQKAISLSLDRVEIPSLVQADRNRLKEVIINLLSNAIKYNTDGGMVAVDCRLSLADAIRISVRDSGAGLSPEQMAKLFQPFNRLGQETGAEQGTGIGLVVCKRLVECMGGCIGVDSTVGKGTTFWIELKTSNEARSPASMRASVPPGEAAPGGEHSRTLLCVEDNAANLLLIEEITARRPDIRLLSARNGRDGIAMARGARPDVILMDISLPDISGIQALQVLAEDPATAHIPVIALSAHAIPSDVRLGLEAGFFRYLTKPIRVHEFLATLDVALDFAKSATGRGDNEGNGCE
jgi:PAS domain S-box-containing protein